jgi:hypothetical protein
MDRRSSTVAYQPRYLLRVHSERINAQDSDQELCQLGRTLPAPHIHPFRDQPLNIRVEILQLRPQQDLLEDVVRSKVYAVIRKRVVLLACEDAECGERRFEVSSLHLVAWAILWWDRFAS